MPTYKLYLNLYKHVFLRRENFTASKSVWTEKIPSREKHQTCGERRMRKWEKRV